MKVTERIIAALLVVDLPSAALAQQPRRTQEPSPVLALVNVNVIPMDRERVEPGQTIVIRNGRIAAIGPVGQVEVPNGAMVVEGSGNYVVPGLTDAHTHLDTTGGGTRPDFGDAPLYLAYGVTTVVNLRGIPEHVVWKRRVESGELLGPAIYTSGPFLDEPRVNSPDDVQRVILEQASEGYDLIKFHPIAGGPGVATTTGLSSQAYVRMIESARHAHMPLVGHAPVTLGLEAVLQMAQPLSHINELTVVYFLEGRTLLQFALATGASLLVLFVAAAIRGTALVVRLWRRSGAQAPSRLERVRSLAGWLFLTGLLEIGCFFLLWPGGMFFDNVLVRPAFTGLAVGVVIVSLVLTVRTAKIWREPTARLTPRFEASLISVAALVLSIMMIHWVSLAWRSGEGGIERLANRLDEAGVPVQTTMVVYDTLIGMNGPDASRILGDPALNVLSAGLRDRWRGMGTNWPVPSTVTTFLIPRYLEFLQQLAAALHRQHVPLMSGTDTMGVPLVLPGTSLHRELQLLTESGLTTFEAIRTATVVPAAFLGRDKEFGTVGVGKRADLLLIEGNPLESIVRLKQPVGVVVRGRWLARKTLDQMLAALAREE